MHCVIDGDQMLYACGFASKGEPISHTLRLIKNKLNEIIEHSQCDTYQVYVEGKGNFRESIAYTKGYKANRTSDKPPSFDEAKQYMVDVWNAELVEGMETDDMVSILLYQDYLCTMGGDAPSVVLSSPDKDLNNTPGWHYRPRTKELEWITENQADRHFAFQLLTGDGVDNIPGLPLVASSTRMKYGLRKAKGCGKVSARGILEESKATGNALEDVVLAYLEWGAEIGWSHEATLIYFMEQAQLLWMVRELDHSGNPVMFKLEVDIYERARARSTEYSRGYTPIGPSDLDGGVH
jgi:hypothetical protein